MALAISEDEILKYAVKNGILNLPYVQNKIIMHKREELLKEHPYKIWEGKDGKWRTYLPDKEKGRVLKKRTTKEAINELIIEYWDKAEKELNPTMRSVFDEWTQEKLKYGEICRGTYDRYEADFVKFIETSELNNIPIADITEEMLETFIKTTIADHKLTSKCYSNIRTLVSGIFKYAKEGTYLIDMTTSSPLLAKKIYDLGKKFNVLDAPVSGGDIGAKNATLSIMVGGDKKDFHSMYSLFECLGKNIIYLGEIGSGQNCKACNQIAIAGTVAAVAESIIYAKKVGLDTKTVLDAISKGAAGSWQMQNNGYKMIEKDYAPGFFNKHFIKDMKIAKEVMDEKGEELPILNKVLEMYEELAKDGFEDMGTQSIIEKYL